MALRSLQIIAVQLTDSGLRLAEGRKAESALTITRLKTFPYEGEDPFMVLHETLRRLKPSRVYIALPTQSLKHHFFSLPPLKKKDAWGIIQRELSQLTSFDINASFFDFVVPKGRSGSLDYSVLTAPRDTIITAISAAQRAGKKPLLATSCPFGLMVALRRFIPTFDAEICASLHIEENTGLLSIFNQGYLSFTRSFSLKGKPPSQNATPETETATTSLYNRIIKETNRSLLFFKQHSHGLMTKTIVLSGDIPGAEELKTAMQEELGVDILLYKPTKEHGITLLGATPEEPASLSLTKYAVPIGLLLTPPPETANLIPETILKKGKIMSGRLIVITFMLLLISGMGVTHYTLSRQTSILRAAVISQKTTRQKMLPIVERIRNIKGDRNRYKQLLLFSKVILAPPSFWTPFWQDISQIIPGKMSFNRADFTVKDEFKGIYRFKFSGLISTETAKEAQEIYQNFIGLLFSSPYIIEGNFSPPEISPVRVSSSPVEEAPENEVLGTLRNKVKEIRQKGAVMTFHLHGILQTSYGKESSP